MKLHRFHPEADEEYAAAAEHYASINPALGGRFYDEIERLIAETCAAPRRFRKIDGDVRRHLSADFPYALLYLDEPDTVWIVAIMPLKRDLEYWKQRLTIVVSVKFCKKGIDGMWLDEIKRFMGRVKVGGEATSLSWVSGLS